MVDGSVVSIHGLNLCKSMVSCWFGGYMNKGACMYVSLYYMYVFLSVYFTSFMTSDKNSLHILQKITLTHHFVILLFKPYRHCED